MAVALPWNDIPTHWQVCFALAWEAWGNNCIPIGALVLSPQGQVLSTGRNRIYEKVEPHTGKNGNALAHAEMEALLALDLDSVDPHNCTLVTSTEPCPMCMGTFYMSGLRTLEFAARDPYAGSTDLLGKTPYLSRKRVKVTGPFLPLEPFFVAMFIEQEARAHGGILPDWELWNVYRQVLPGGVALGLELTRLNTLPALHQERASASQAYSVMTDLCANCLNQDK